MTLAEAVWSAEAWKTNQNLEWDRARRIISSVENAGVIARGGKVTRSMLKTPMDIAKLPWDNKKLELSEEDAKPPKQLYELAEKCGVINKERKSLKEIFKAS